VAVGQRWLLIIVRDARLQVKPPSRNFQMPFKVLIADPHEVIRVGLRAILKNEEFQIVGEAATGKEALKLVARQQPDLVVLAVRMQDGDGLECLARIKLENLEIPVVMFSDKENPTYSARALALGASGFLSTRAAASDIVEALKSAAIGESIWSKDALRRISGALAPMPRATEFDIPLTKREQEVLKQLALGLTNKEIGKALGISYETVKEHVQHILRKLDVSDRTQAAVWTVRMNLA
jgi:DNA-binding NarL/FixJ family response regulator